MDKTNQTPPIQDSTPFSKNHPAALETLSITEEEENQILTGNTFPEVGSSIKWFLEKGFHVSSKSPYPNRHIPEQVDTIVSLSKGKSKVELYHAPGKYMVQSAVIHDLEVNLPEDIHTGLKKEVLFQKIDQSSLSNKNLKELRIKSPVTETSITFNFEEGRIISIHYTGYVD